MENIVKTLEELLKINSPSGYTDEVIEYIEDRFKNDDVHIVKTNKGSLFISLTENPRLALAGHIDTLGAMVKEVKSDGKLVITEIGGYRTNSIEGEYVTVRNYDGKLFTGTYLMNNPADHVNKDLGSAKRGTDNMSVRLDALIKSPEDLKKLNIGVGNYVFFDRRFEKTDTGYIKSRFLDNKACSAVMIEILKEMVSSGNKKDIGFYFSNYEEVGHGACVGIPSSIKELLVLDMAVVGDGCTGREDAVSICAKDSTGPYDFHITEKLRKLAKDNKIDYEVDIYPYYGSDGSAARNAGLDAKVGLIGPGVSASHGMERTHEKGLKATYDLTKAYIDSF